MTMPTSAVWRNSSSDRTCWKIASVRSLVRYDSMSTWTNARCSRATRSSCRSRAFTRSAVPSGSIGVELAVERRELDRDVHARQLAEQAAIDLRHLGPGVDRRGDAADQVEIGLQVALGLDFAGHRLAQDVEREGPLQLPLAHGRGQHFGRVDAGDEPPGVRLGIAARGQGQRPAGQRTAGRPPPCPSRTAEGS